MSNRLDPYGTEMATSSTSQMPQPTRLPSIRPGVCVTMIIQIGSVIGKGTYRQLQEQ